MVQVQVAPGHPGFSRIHLAWSVGHCLNWTHIKKLVLIFTYFAKYHSKYVDTWLDPSMPGESQSVLWNFFWRTVWLPGMKHFSVSSLLRKEKSKKTGNASGTTYKLWVFLFIEVKMPQAQPYFLELQLVSQLSDSGKPLPNALKL